MLGTVGGGGDGQSRVAQKPDRRGNTLHDRCRRVLDEALDEVGTPPRMPRDAALRPPVAATRAAHPGGDGNARAGCPPDGRNALTTVEMS